MKCKFCQHYTFEGHRGGYCALLCVPVQGCLQACTYAHVPFPSLEIGGVDDDIYPYPHLPYYGAPAADERPTLVSPFL